MIRPARVPILLHSFIATLACQPASHTAPPLSEAAPTPAVGKTRRGQSPGSAADLRSRGAVRASAAKQSASELAERWLTLTVQTQAADSTWWAFPENGQLRTGEVLVTEVELQRPAHLYVINVGASGEPVLLYPDPKLGDADTLRGQGVHRLPPKRSSLPYIKLNAEVGTEHLYVIASPLPIAAVDEDLGSLISTLQRGESPALATPADPNQAARAKGHGSNSRTDARRGRGRRPKKAADDTAIFRKGAKLTPEMPSRGAVRSRFRGAAVDATADEEGISVIRFRFEHI